MRHRFFAPNSVNLGDLADFLVVVSRPVVSSQQYPEGVDLEFEVSANQLERVANKATARGLVFGGHSHYQPPEPAVKPEPPKRTRKPKKEPEPEVVEEALAEEAEAAEE